MEEYVEGELLYHWIMSKQLLTKSEISFITVNEYVNGLADFTGEIGRLAVMYASNRQLEPIQSIQQVNIVIYDYIVKLNVLNNNNYTKKLDMIYMNSKKIDDIIYELILLKKTGKLYSFLSPADTMGSVTKESDDSKNKEDESR
jgi:predicted translin family RNA/ssDNA-binding protein